MMTNSVGEPVEISMNFGPGEWTETTLAALVGTYQKNVEAMGAATAEVLTRVDRFADGSASVQVSWDRRGTIMNPMTGEDVSGGLAPDGSRPGLIMYTEENGETFVELQKEPTFTKPFPFEPARGTGAANNPGDRSAAGWFWVAVLGLLAAAGGIAWTRHKINKEAETSTRGRPLHQANGT